jgi:predicted PurR-regulated permease PerM
MNALVGVATGLAMWSLGLENAVLWGCVAFVLNYVPILGPLTGLVIFLAVGMLSLDPLWKAFMPMTLYAVIHVLEGESFTPMLLAKRFTLNPVLVIVALLFWDWMWGIPGAILAVPMLAITKIVCDRIRPLAAFGHFLEGEKQSLEP